MVANPSLNYQLHLRNIVKALFALAEGAFASIFFEFISCVLMEILL